MLFSDITKSSSVPWSGSFTRMSDAKSPSMSVTVETATSFDTLTLLENHILATLLKVRVEHDFVWTDIREEWTDGLSSFVDRLESQVNIGTR